MKKLILAVFVLLAGCTAGPSSVKVKEMPRLEKRGEVTQLIVDGKPYLVLAGELHNSSSSSREYMKPVWKKLKSMGLNTVLAVVSWEQIEPREGVFDFSMVDDLLADARKHDMRLVLLWFGSWKNGITSYVPEWVQKDPDRFPLVRTKEGYPLPILSPMSGESAKQDAKAYAALMKYVAAADADRTVIMVQMQNEIGIHGYSRDYSPAAVELFNGKVPQELMNYMLENKDSLLPELRAQWSAAGGKSGGTWQEVFGANDYTDEIFMAWHYATYIEEITAAGRAEYDLPTFVNAWIVQPQDKHPGDYPSGGPQAHVHDIYRAGAPSIDILAPDIYLPDFPTILQEYSRGENPVFIPESRAGVIGAANAFYAIAQMGAIGYSPFGIEGYMSKAEVVSGAPSATESTVKNSEVEAFSEAYKVLENLMPLILEHQAAGTIRGAWLKESNPVRPDATVTLGDYNIRFELRKTRNSDVLPPVGYGLVIKIADDEYIVAGADVQVTFEPLGGGIAGLAKVQEGEFVRGRWVAGRWLNGDEVQLRYDLLNAAAENQSGAGLRFRGEIPHIQRVWLYNYK